MITEAQYAAGCENARHLGIKEGILQQQNSLAEVRKSCLIELVNAVSQLAQANAKLTYAVSHITDKLL